MRTQGHKTGPDKSQQGGDEGRGERTRRKRYRAGPGSARSGTAAASATMVDDPAQERIAEDPIGPITKVRSS